MKIMYIFGHYFPEFLGGGEISNKMLVNQMAKLNDVSVITLSDKIPTSKKKYEDVEVHYIKRRVKQFGKTYFIKYKINTNMAFRKVQKIIENKKPDLIHASSVDGVVLSYKINKKLKIPYISHIRSYGFKCINPVNMMIRYCKKCNYECFPRFLRFPLKILYQEPLNKALSNSTKIITISEWMRKTLEYEGYKDIEVVYNPLSFKIKPWFNLNKKKNQILFAGALSDKKGINDLIKGFRLFIKKHPEFKLKIAGKGNVNIKDDKNIELMGLLPHEDTLYEMRKSIICIFPSKYPEPFGRVVVEAQSVGSLVIGSNRGGMPELLKHGIITKVIPKDINESLEKAVKTDKLTYEKITKNAYQFIKKKCTEDIMKKKIQSIYKDILN